jgi:hypothetical protein
MKAPIIRAPTGGMKRRWTRWLGILILLLNFGLLFVFGFDVLSVPSRFVQVALGVIGGLLLILASIDLPWNVEWHRLAGVGYLCLAASYLFANLLAEDGALWVVGALALAYIGYDIARSGRHFDIDADT